MHHCIFHTCLFLVLLHLLCNVVISEGRNGYYRAGIVEVTPWIPEQPLTRNDAVKGVLESINNFQGVLKEASEEKLDVVVFPEYGLFAPAFTKKSDIEPIVEPIPVGDFPCSVWGEEKERVSPITYALSCLAVEYSVTLVVNYGDCVLKAPNTTSDIQNIDEPWKRNSARKRDSGNVALDYGSSWICSADHHYFYNTLVAFSPEGQILEKYWKEHLYYESYYDVPPRTRFSSKSFNLTLNEPSIVNITFGMGICFDILFRQPFVPLVERGVRNFVFASYWVNYPPIYYGVEVQAGWSGTFQSNLIAAGSGMSWQNSGSGIYTSGKPLVVSYLTSQLPNPKLSVSDVPIVPSKFDNSIFPYACKDAPGEYLNATFIEIGDPARGSYNLETSYSFEADISILEDDIICSLSFVLRSDDGNNTNSSQSTPIYGLWAATGTQNKNVFRSVSCMLNICPEAEKNKINLDNFEYNSGAHIKEEPLSNPKVCSNVVEIPNFIVPPLFDSINIRLSLPSTMPLTVLPISLEVNSVLNRFIYRENGKVKINNLPQEIHEIDVLKDRFRGKRSKSLDVYEIEMHNVGSLWNVGFSCRCMGEEKVCIK